MASGSVLLVEGQLRASDLRCLGMIVDADSPVMNRWAQVRAAFLKARYDPPVTLPTDGLVLLREGEPTVGVWMMPDNRADGMLEDFAAMLVPADDRLLPRARAVVEEIPAEDRKFAPVHEGKAVIYTWLAWQSEPALRIGQAVARKYLDPASPLALDFVNWIRRLHAASSDR
jgi:hypothetical protein